MAKFDELVTGLPVDTGEPALHPIDMSHFFGLPEGSEIFHFADPSTPELFSTPRIVAQITSQPDFSDWPKGLLDTLATIITAHRLPAQEENSSPIWLLYAHLVKRTEKQPQLWTRFVKDFATTFPHLIDMGKAAIEEKK